MHEKNAQLKESIDLNECSYINWHKTFDKITPRSICVPLPSDILDYLLDEMIILPKECYEKQQNTVEASTSSKTFDSSDDGNDDPEPEFPEFSAKIDDSIKRLGGSAFVKTNWHCPKDAFWITAGQTMCCKDITDVYQLLKASGICKEDLSVENRPTIERSTNAIDAPATSETSKCQQFLVFKKWLDIHPGTEFRCFVRSKRLIGISPRDWPQYYEHICAQKLSIVSDIVTLFKEHIKPKFPLYDYIFDVVRDSKDRVFLLDFSPFSEKHSEPLAFEWNELTDDNVPLEEEEDDPEFRYLSSDCGIQPNKRNNYGIPKDVIDMFANPQPDRSETESTDENTNTLNHVINSRLEQIFLNQPNETNESDDDQE